MSRPLLVFDGGDRGRVEIAADAVDGAAAGVQLRFLHRRMRIEVVDHLDTGQFDDLWDRLGDHAGDEAETVRLAGREGRIELTLRIAADVAGLRAVLRPASGVRVELELAVEPDREAWRQVLAGWLRDRTATDLDLPGL